MAFRLSAALTLMLLLGLGHLETAHSQHVTIPCPAKCDKNMLQPVNATGSSSTNVMNAVKVSLDSILGAISSFVPVVGEAAKGAQQLMDTGFSLWAAWSSVPNPLESVKNSLHNDLVSVQDFLVCEMQNIVFQSERDIINTMTATQLANFNAFVDNAVASLADQCGALNCLNTSSLAPSQRNAALDDTNCVVPNPSKDCANVKSWDPMAVVPCTYNPPDGGDPVHGVCDPDGQCYSAQITHQGARDFFAGVSARFNSGNINSLFGLDQFAADDMDALVLGAKMSLLQINLYQQLIMLGSANGEMATLKAFSGRAATWLEDRYNYLLDMDRIRGQIANFSSFTNGTTDLGIVNPLQGIDGDSISPPDEHGDYADVQCSGSYSLLPCYLWTAHYGSYQLAWGCSAAQTLPLYQQTESYCYWANLRAGSQEPGDPAPCQVDTLPYGLADWQNGNYVGVCYTAPGASTGSCRLDNTFPDVWMGRHNGLLQSNFTQAKEALAQQLQANLTTALVDVNGTIQNLKKLAKIGMPAGSLNILATSYPLQKCNLAAQSQQNAVAATATATFLHGASDLLKGDGAMPLPPGAMLLGNTSNPVARAATGGRRMKL